jgi:hypothetical protein
MDERQQNNMSTVLGNKVLIQLYKQTYDMLQIQGVESERFVARVVGLDGYGLWIENPRYCTTPVFTSAGEYIAPENRAEECQRAVQLLPWSAVLTVVQFPDHPDYNGGIDEIEIGFKAHARDQVSPLLEGVTLDGQGPDAPAGKLKANKGKPGKGKERKRG